MSLVIDAVTSPQGAVVAILFASLVWTFAIVQTIRTRRITAQAAAWREARMLQLRPVPAVPALRWEPKRLPAHVPAHHAA